MTRTEISSLEQELGVKLPQRYQDVLENHGLSGEWTEHPELFTDVTVLRQENRHFLQKSDDLSDVKQPGLLGAIKFFLLYGSGKRLVDYRRKVQKKWVQGKRFVVGNDLGEEQYFIVLDDPEIKVHRFDLELQRSKVVAASIEAWLIEVRRRQRESETDAKT
jgi:hypothetical protein